MSNPLLCPDCGRLISTRFPVHSCEPEAKKEDTMQGLMNRLTAREAQAAPVKRAEVVKVTPQQAEEWLAMSPYIEQRKVREHWVNTLATAIVTGEFETTMIKFRMIGGQWFLVDGQHRLRAIIKTGIPTDLTVMWESAETMDDVAKSYRNIDVGLIRTVVDRLGTDAGIKGLGLSGSQLTSIAGAYRVLSDGFVTSKPRHDDPNTRSIEARIRAIHRWADQGYMYFKSVQGATAMLAHRFMLAPVCAVGLVTMKYQEDRAVDFWTSVARNDQLKARSPEQKLIEYLLSPASHGGQSNEIARKVATCWNAYYQGREYLINLKVLSTTLVNPIRIMGTPYNGQRVIRDTDAAITDAQEQLGIQHPKTEYTVRELESVK